MSLQVFLNIKLNIMKQRVNIEETFPKAYKAMFGLELALQGGLITKSHKNLIKIRTSQINGCAYCIDMHTKEALTAGETQQRIFLVSAWAETLLFTPEEKAILSLVEAVTLIHQAGVPDEVYEEVSGFFGEDYIAELIMAIITINGWNRLAIATHLQVLTD